MVLEIGKNGENSDSAGKWADKVLEPLRNLSADRNAQAIRQAAQRAHAMDIFREGAHDPDELLKIVLTKAALNRGVMSHPSYAGMPDSATRISTAIADGYLSTSDIEKAFQEDSQGYSPRI